MKMTIKQLIQQLEAITDKDLEVLLEGDDFDHDEIHGIRWEKMKDTKDHHRFDSIILERR